MATTATPPANAPGVSCWIPSDQTPFRGETVFMGGHDWVVPSLSVRHFREHFEELRGMKDVPEDQVLQAMEKGLPIVLLALQRNYPSMKQDDLENLLDLNTFATVVGAISGQSGMRKRAAPGE